MFGPEQQWRKRPVVIHAAQYLGDEPYPIHTREGTMMADPGDYIVTGVKGEQYPCKPDIFALTYDLVTD